jgi:hypothetical protein
MPDTPLPLVITPSPQLEIIWHVDFSAVVIDDTAIVVIKEPGCQ